MLNILSKIVRFNTLSVLGIFRKDEGDVYEILVIKKNKTKLNIITALHFDNYNDAINNIKPQIPLLLVIDGKGILNKGIDLLNEKDTQWKKNLDTNTIYYTDLIVENNIFTSFCRKQVIDEYISDLKQKKIQLIDFYIGPLFSTLLHPIIKSDKILSNDTMLEFNSHLYKINRAPEIQQNYNLDDIILSQYQLPLFGAAIAFFFNVKEITKSESKQLAKEEIIYQKAFNILGLLMLAAFFTALLVSYLVIDYFSSENIKLTEKNIFFNKNQKQIEELEKQKENKLNILSQSGQLSKHFLSFYAYELLKSVPVQISLNQINILPLSEEIKDTKKIKIEPNTIVVKGSTEKGQTFDDWIKKLKKMSWIKKFEVVSLKKDKKEIQQFEIKILINDF